MRKQLTLIKVAGVAVSLAAAGIAGMASAQDVTSAPTAELTYSEKQAYHADPAGYTAGLSASEAAGITAGAALTSEEVKYESAKAIQEAGKGSTIQSNGLGTGVSADQYVKTFEKATNGGTELLTPGVDVDQTAIDHYQNDRITDLENGVGAAAGLATEDEVQSAKDQAVVEAGINTVNHVGDVANHIITEQAKTDAAQDEAIAAGEALDNIISVNKDEEGKPKGAKVKGNLKVDGHSTIDGNLNIGGNLNIDGKPVATEEHVGEEVGKALTAAEAAAQLAADAAQAAAIQAANDLAAKQAEINTALKAKDGVFTQDIIDAAAARDQLKADLDAAKAAAASTAAALTEAKQLALEYAAANDAKNAEQDAAISSNSGAIVSGDAATLSAAIAEVNALKVELQAAIAGAVSAEAAARAAADKALQAQISFNKSTIDSNTTRIVSLEKQWETDPILGATKVVDAAGNEVVHVNYNDGSTEAKVARVKDINTIADRVADNTSRIQSLESAVFTDEAKEDSVDRFIGELWGKAKAAQQKNEPLYVMTSAGMVDLRGWHGSTSRHGHGIMIALDKTLAYDVMGLNSVWVTLK